jgi:hypothetical protein
MHSQAIADEVRSGAEDKLRRLDWIAYARLEGNRMSVLWGMGSAMSDPLTSAGILSERTED